MGLTITLGVLLLLILWVLFTPIILQIDTVNHQYYLKMTGIVTITPFLNEEGFKLSIRTPFYAFRIAPKRSKEKWQRKKKKSSSEKVSLSKMLAIIKSCKVEQFKVMIDTNDYYWNGLLVPVAFVLHHNGMRVSINFLGKNDCQLRISNSIGKMGWAYLSSGK